MNKQQRENMDSDQVHNARIGYQAAIDMWTHAGEEVWARFNVMLVANSIVIAVIGLALTSQRALPVFTALLPVAGLVLCVLWFILMRRGFDYQIYYILSARELEEQYLAPTVKTVSRGGAWADGKKVSLQIGDTSIARRMSMWSRVTTAHGASYIVIAIFAVIYLAALLQI